MKAIGSGLLEGISTRSDGSVKLVISTQEMDSTEAARFFELRNKFIKFLLSDNNIDPTSEALINDLHLRDTRKVKSPSQRLRAVLFLIHKEKGGNEQEFDEWYKVEMENIINHFKGKLQPA